jgi:exodeoxyribonuclease X
MTSIIRVVDLETTGLSPEEGASICEIGWFDIRMKPDLLGMKSFSVPDGFSGGNSVLLNPGHPIPPETSAIHHIIDEDVHACPPWRAASSVFAPSDPDVHVLAFAAHSAKFERQWCEEWADGVPWICTYKCALRLWPDAPAHSNQALRYWRKPEGLDREVASVSHRAFPDAYVTAFLLRDMLQTEGVTLEQLVQWSNEPALQVKCWLGKWRGTPWREVDDGFLEWVSMRDFDEDVLFTVRHEMDRRDEEARKQQEESAQ